MPKSRVGNGRASQTGQSKDRQFLGCLTEDTSDGYFLWPGYHVESGFPGVLSHWKFDITDEHCMGSFPRWMWITWGPSPAIPCYRPWLCSETQSTSGLYHHPIRSTWAHHGWCWQAPSWWKRTVLEEITGGFFSSTGPHSLHTASLHWLQLSGGANRWGRADPALYHALPGTWPMCLRHILSMDQTNNRTSGKTKQ